MVEHDIRYTVIEDEPHLVTWLSDKDNLMWFPLASENEVKEAAKNWIAYSKFKCSLTATINKTPCAIGTLFLMPYRKVAHHCMFYLIVDKKWQKQGIGESMLKNLFNLAKNYFRLESIHAEVYGGCPILPLLAQNNFIEFARQEHFVKEGTEYKERILLEHFF